jgi:hypothetical protein
MRTLAVTPEVPRSTLNGSQAVDEQAAAKTLGQLIGDVQSGRLSAAQTDLASLTQQLGASATSDATSALGKLLTELGGDLSSGNLSGAQASVGGFLRTLSGETRPTAGAA